MAAASPAAAAAVAATSVLAEQVRQVAQQMLKLRGAAACSAGDLQQDFLRQGVERRRKTPGVPASEDDGNT
jgi:hypothetical protein